MDALLASYLSLTAALVITPGATTAVVARNTLATGWRGGLAAAAGAALGNTTHATAAGLGAAVLVSRSPNVFVAIKLAGGIYLAWLGVASLRRVIIGNALPVAAAITAARDRARHHALREGLIVNLLNPAIATFYLAVVPSFVPGTASSGQYAKLSAIHIAMAFACHGIWAFGLDRLRHLMTSPRARLTLEAVTAAALLLLAARVLLAAIE